MPLWYTGPMDYTKAFYNQYAEVFEKKTQGLARMPWLKLFMRALPKHGRVLDLGCAYGRDAELLTRKGFAVTGVDFSGAMIRKARRRVPKATFIVQDVQRLPLRKNTFDGVWASAVLLHVSKKAVPRILHKLYAVLRPGGLLFIGTYLGKGEGLVMDKRYQGARKYYSYFSVSEIKKRLVDAGFSLIHFVSRPPDAYEKRRVVELVAKKTV